MEQTGKKPPLPVESKSCQKNRHPEHVWTLFFKRAATRNLIKIKCGCSYWISHLSGRSFPPTVEGTHTQSHRPGRCRFHPERTDWSCTHPLLRKHTHVSSLSSYLPSHVTFEENVGSRARIRSYCGPSIKRASPYLTILWKLSLADTEQECGRKVNILTKAFHRKRRKNSGMLTNKEEKKQRQEMWSSDSLWAQVGPSQPGGHWQLKPVGTSWHVPPLAQGLEMQACSADGGRGVGGESRGMCVKGIHVKQQQQFSFPFPINVTYIVNVNCQPAHLCRRSFRRTPSDRHRSTHLVRCSCRSLRWHKGGGDRSNSDLEADIH